LFSVPGVNKSGFPCVEWFGSTPAGKREGA